MVIYWKLELESGNRDPNAHCMINDDGSGTEIYLVMYITGANLASGANILIT